MRKRSFAFIVLGGLFGIHLLMTALYLAPINPMTNSYANLVHSYMEPLFSQNWSLFAPDPAKSSLQLWYRCTNEQNASSWMDPISPLVQDHQRTRFTFRGKLLYIYQGIARDALNTYVQTKSTLGCGNTSQCHEQTLRAVASSDAVRLAHRFVGDMCRSSTDKHARGFQSAEFMVVKVYPKPFSKRLDPQSSPQLESLRFHSFAL